MTAHHASSEQLALLAMAAEVPDHVRPHVASRRTCAKDLAIIRSLLNADDPDSDPQPQGDSHDRTPQSDLPPAAFTAMADTADGRPVDEPTTVLQPGAGVASARMGSDTHAGGRRNSIALVVGIIVATTLIVMVILLWR